MIVDIDKIVVRDRVRKDLGDIDDLARDIREHGLINPITINRSFELIAGERRLEACRSLGWWQVEVRLIDTVDEVGDFEVEMSENMMRRGFTGSELAEGIRRQMAIESEKARERQKTSTGGANPKLVKRFHESDYGDSRGKAAKAFGISGTQASRVLFVDENKEWLDQKDFAAWNDGKISTNKALRKIKAAQRDAEDSRQPASDCSGCGDDSFIKLATSKIGTKKRWTTNDVRKLLKDPPMSERSPCYICGGHAGITELHHVVHISELTHLLNVGLIGPTEVSTPTVWLCPNCHTYVHAAVDGDDDAAAQMMQRDDTWACFSVVIKARTDHLEKILETADRRTKEEAVAG